MCRPAEIHNGMSVIPSVTDCIARTELGTLAMDGVCGAVLEGTVAALSPVNAG